ncbi:DUF5994 family protein [Tsukamurella sp. 1534]|uniref:DUF5994 family protein n=1 Tax=Tsukamurella sp. 1534 TaxID=1151061 RepID=UPI00352780D2
MLGGESDTPPGPSWCSRLKNQGPSPGSERPMTHPLPTTHPRRLRLKPVGAAAGPTDGAWWPQSRDLRTELLAIAGPIHERLSTITTVGYCAAEWSPTPEHFSLGRHPVRATASARLERGTVEIGGPDATLTIAVIAPDATPAAARTAMVLAMTSSSSSETASADSTTTARTPPAAGQHIMSALPARTYHNVDGSTERWWHSRALTHRQVTIETSVKTLDDHDQHREAVDIELLITDQHSPRRIGIPVGVLDQVIAALTTARGDAAHVLGSEPAVRHFTA